MTRADNHWGADLARRLGVGGTIERLDNREGATLHIRCAGRNGEEHVVDVRIRPNLDPNGTAKHMLNAGWTLGRRKIYCPDCGSRKTPKQKIEAAPLPMIPPEVTPMPMSPQSAGGYARAAALSPERRREIARKGGQSQARVITLAQRQEWGRKGKARQIENRLKREEQRLLEQGRIPAAPCPQIKETKPMATAEQANANASEQARAAKRAVMQWLDEAFNVEKGTFQAGVSDATIAKETGVAEAKVKALREEFYGPLGEPDELRELKEALAAANKALDLARSVWQQEASRIGRRFEGLCAKMGWPIS